MNKLGFKLALVFGLLLSAIYAVPFLNVGKADPIGLGGYVPPPAGTEPPQISILYSNNTVSTNKYISLAVNASIPKGNFWFFTNIWYVDDWQQGNNSLYQGSKPSQTNFYFNKTLTEIPEGNHSVTVFATGQGSIINETLYAYYFIFEVVGSSTVNFVVDTIPPTVSFLTAENMTYDTSNVTLNFLVNKPVSQIVYSLDNQMNVTANENNALALSNLSNGDHNVTVYAQDDAGLVGASNTLYFIVNQPRWPEPSILSMTADIAGASAMLTVFAGLFVYFKKHNPFSGKPAKAKRAPTN